jgi:hypothetical protein
MLNNPTLAKALVGAEANNAVAAVKYAAPTADETKVGELISHEVGRIEARVSVMLSHIEGNYESQVANLKLKLTTQKFLYPILIALPLIGGVIGFVIGKIV